MCLHNFTLFSSLLIPCCSSWNELSSDQCIGQCLQLSQLHIYDETLPVHHIQRCCTGRRSGDYGDHWTTINSLFQKPVSDRQKYSCQIAKFKGKIINFNTKMYYNKKKNYTQRATAMEAKPMLSYYESTVSVSNILNLIWFQFVFFWDLGTSTCSSISRKHL